MKPLIPTNYRLVPPQPLWHNIILILSIIILTFMTFAKRNGYSHGQSSNTVSVVKTHSYCMIKTFSSFLICWYVNKTFHLKQKKSLHALIIYRITLSWLLLATVEQKYYIGLSANHRWLRWFLLRIWTNVKTDVGILPAPFSTIQEKKKLCECWIRFSKGFLSERNTN